MVRSVQPSSRTRRTRNVVGLGAVGALALALWVALIVVGPTARPVTTPQPLAPAAVAVPPVTVPARPTTTPSTPSTPPASVAVAPPVRPAPEPGVSPTRPRDTRDDGDGRDRDRGGRDDDRGRSDDRGRDDDRGGDDSGSDDGDT